MSSLSLLQAALRLANQTEGFQAPGHIAWRAHTESLKSVLADGKNTLFICPENRRHELTAQYGQAQGSAFSPSVNSSQDRPNGTDNTSAAFSTIYWEGFNAESDFSHYAQSIYERLKRQGRLVFPAILADEQTDSVRPFVVEGLECRTAITEPLVAENLCEAGFHGITYALASEVPVCIQDGIEYRLFTISAYKGKAGVCLDQGHAVIYKGPWKHTVDDDGHTYLRGVRTAVCEKTFNLLMSQPYQGQFIPVRCYVEPPLEKSGFFDCNTPSIRDPKVTKGLLPITGSAEESCCANGSSCC
ncbi:methyltransferase type 11 [Pseudomonas aeruginosa]|uniref:methyltransferase type 11 n=1 Tax=Pseudomonas aeruginosa TaxID=287 RepID=UPI00157B7EFC|nr:methyltransferase type 11 [Pseudomonas aeruginosa]MCP9254402.1 methyltransferase type 11 [Pseudomonas aeruginosa]MDA3425309.1 methyltransferase type 11 [Pseudomonas aeruginosa]MDG3692254.1 methyltransferase type 11 [Pseudomonas aeruginosa]MDY1055271.1 methyltransferase type 11 [Pseudomonas aeruginosa]HBN9841387.1 methyltransferase type 11 [Pseudomonas aeruginosa]